LDRDRQITTWRWKRLKPQFEVPENCQMPKVVISGNYYGSKVMPTLNNLLAAYGKSPKAGSGMKRKYQRICCDEIRDQLGDWKTEKPLIVHYIYVEPRDGHPADHSNAHAFCSKVFLDALQDCGTIKGDDPRYVLNETHDFYTLPEKWGEPYIEIYLEEVEDV
jgi:hypothetical protein